MTSVPQTTPLTEDKSDEVGGIVHSILLSLVEHAEGWTPGYLVSTRIFSEVLRLHDLGIDDGTCHDVFVYSRDIAKAVKR